MTMKLLVVLSALQLAMVVDAASASYGGHSMVAPLRRVIVRRPDVAFGSADPVAWHYTAQPNLLVAQKEHDHIVDILRNEGVEVLYHDADLPRHADSIFVHDPILITNHGAIVLRMGKALRCGEESAIADMVKSLGIPILYTLHGDATAEGGDILWIDEKTLVVGRGFRTNQEGINQIRVALAPYGVDVLQVDLPYDQGKDACLHLQSLISFVDYDLAVVYLKYLPVAFFEMLQQRGINLITVSKTEYLAMAPNILAIKPGVVLMLQDNIELIMKLMSVGCKVYTYQGNEISHKAEGGATCLTRPVLRVF